LRHDVHSTPSFSSESLFAASLEPVLILDSATEAIVEANPAAAQLLGVDRSALVGIPFLRIFDSVSSLSVQTSLAAVRSALGGADSVQVCTQDGGTPLSVTVSLFRASPRTFLLVRLAAAGDGGLGDFRAGAPSAVFHAIEATSVAFLVTDSGFFLEYANRAFIDLVGLASQADVRSKSLARWLKFTAADLERLREQVSHRQAATLFCTGLETEHQPSRMVEVCAVVVPNGQDTCWGFTVRELPRLN
jgi:PAS domain-containing protein